MKRLLFMVIVTIAVLASFARPEKETGTTGTHILSADSKNTVDHKSAGDSTAQYKKG